MRKFYFLILSLSFLWIPLNAANLFAVLIADTNDDEIGEECSIDIKKMSRLAQKISHYSNLDLFELKIKGSTPAKILNKIAALEVKDEDMILFYYTGHGYRTDDMGSTPPWPIYEFPEDNEGLDSGYLMGQLEMKNPRFLLAINDCCNVFLEDDEEEPILIKKPKPGSQKLKARRVSPHKDIQESLVAQNYKNLFLGYRGSIKIVSSRPGEYSHTTEDSKEDGGQYTLSFLRSLQKALKSPKTPLWETILERAAVYVNDEEQHPLWSLQIQQCNPLTGFGAR